MKTKDVKKEGDTRPGHSVPVFGPKHENPAPQFPRKLPGSFWGVTTFFNPAK